eukprot:TRINITY_DN31633_c0_g1_i1.p2 TRINITY_DN31633_c0_g1~~TRINITY_DN31633_c0_g1_i1.p2  ORF type:complete len:114 (-),score=30.56 TRINITY_DN31633_c0_g1_i1:4-345(-)
MTVFLEELRSGEAEKQTLPPTVDGGEMGRKGRGRGRLENSTNLFVANLPASITEGHLVKRFAKFGDIASIKIMWPRGQEQNIDGFVCFMNRRDAEEAKREMQDAIILGNQTRR